MARTQISADWIQVRLDLPQNPKLLQMVSKLSKTIGLYVLAVSPDDLLSGVTSRVTCHVTHLVTCHALTDVTICALVRVWGAANTFMREGVILGASLDWVDGVAKIPAFGKAMESVGWVQITPAGLRFPNFEEWNRPKTNDLRTSPARRKAIQRLRDWLISHDESHADYHTKVTELSQLEGRDMSVTCHALKERKGQYISKRESSASATEPMTELALQADAIASVYPRQDDPLTVRNTILSELQRGTSAEEMRTCVQRCVAFIRSAPGGAGNRYVPKAATFFSEQQWRSPEAFEQRWQPNPVNGNGTKETPTLTTAPKGGW